MVLTTFECWAHGDGAGDAATVGANFETGPTRAAVNDVFNPRVVSHMTSNGYYGYVYVNDANNNNNNNNSSSNAAVEATAAQAGVAARCKKRCFVNDGSSAAAEMDTFFSEGAGETEPAMAKRCRFDDGDLTAQYFNDFFSLPATQIGTQTCLMDCDMPAAEQPPQAIHIIEQYQQQQQLPRLNQHYQDPQQQHKLSNALNPIEKCAKHKDANAAVQTESKVSAATEAAADLYVATHGGCLHHFTTQPLQKCKEIEFDI